MAASDEMPRDRSMLLPDEPEFEPIVLSQPRRRWGLWLSLVALLLLGGAAFGGFYFLDGWLGEEVEPGVPLIRADAGPVKVRPESPGGMEVPDQDKLVYNRMQGAREAPPVEQLLPPPETPLPPPAPKPAPQEMVEPQPQPAPEAPARAAGIPEETPPAEPGQPENLIAEAPPAAGETTAAAKPEEPGEEAAEAVAEEVAAAPAKLAPAKQPEPKTPGAPIMLTKPQTPPAAAAPAPAAGSKRPAVPTTQEVLAAQRPPSAPLPPEPEEDKKPRTEIRPPPKGGYRIQVASVRSPDGAEREWKRLRRKHSDLLDGLPLTVVKADLGAKKGVYFRLQAGPVGDETAARAFCAKLKKRKVGCLIVRPR